MRWWIPTRLEERVLEIATRDRRNAPLSLAGNKRVMRALRDPRLPEELERELIELRESCFRSEDFREGVRAFAEKRKPVWRGRDRVGGAREQRRGTTRAEFVAFCYRQAVVKATLSGSSTGGHPKVTRA